MCLQRFRDLPWFGLLADGRGSGVAWECRTPYLDSAGLAWLLPTSVVRSPQSKTERRVLASEIPDVAAIGFSWSGLRQEEGDEARVRECLESQFGREGLDLCSLGQSNEITIRGSMPAESGADVRVG